MDIVKRGTTGQSLYHPLSTRVSNIITPAGLQSEKTVVDRTVERREVGKLAAYSSPPNAGQLQKKNHVLLLILTLISRSAAITPFPTYPFLILGNLSSLSLENGFTHPTNSKSKHSKTIATAARISCLAKMRPGQICAPPPYGKYFPLRPAVEQTTLSPS